MNGYKALEMVKVFKNGLMAAGTLGSGRMIRHVGRVDCIIQMEICMMESGCKTKHMAKVSIFIQMEPFMKGLGIKTSNMVEVLKYGLMEQGMMGISLMVKKKVEVFFNLQMAQYLREILETMKSMEKESIFGVMVKLMKVIGYKIRCMAMEF